MQTASFEFRVMPKKFQVDSGSRLSDMRNAEGLKTSPRLQRRLHKLKKHAARKTAAAKIFEHYQSGPIGVKGQNFDDTDNLKRHKAKYYSNFSCSQTSLVTYAHAPDVGQFSREMSSLSFAKDAKETMSSARSINSYFDYICPRPSIASDKSGFVAGYNDGYFDLLDLPGHFNTRGVYGQKAKVAQLSITRAKSDLVLDHLRTRFRETGRQKTNLLSYIRPELKFEISPRKNTQNLQLPNLVKPKYTVPPLNLGPETKTKETNCNRGDIKVKKTPKTKTPHTSKDTPKDEIITPQREKTTLSLYTLKYGNKANLNEKRTSMDATTQTDHDLEDYDENAPLVDTSILL